MHEVSNCLRIQDAHNDKPIVIILAFDLPHIHIIMPYSKVVGGKADGCVGAVLYACDYGTGKLMKFDSVKFDNASQGPALELLVEIASLLEGNCRHRFFPLLRRKQLRTRIRAS